MGTEKGILSLLAIVGYSKTSWKIPSMLKVGFLMASEYHCYINDYNTNLFFGQLLTTPNPVPAPNQGHLAENDRQLRTVADNYDPLPAPSQGHLADSCGQLRTVTGNSSSHYNSSLRALCEELWTLADTGGKPYSLYQL